MTIAQFSFNVLVALQSFLGVEPYPEDPSSDWEIVQEWTEIEHGHYETVLQSKSLPQQCRENPEKIVEFPSVVMGVHDIYADGKLVYTSSNLLNEGYSSSFGSPMVKCKIFYHSETVRWRAEANSVWYRVLRSYPRLQSSSIRKFFNEYSYLVSSGCMLILMVISFLLFAGKIKNIDLMSILAHQLMYSIFLLTFSVGLINLNISNIGVHKIMCLSLALGNVMFTASLGFRFNFPKMPLVIAWVTAALAFLGTIFSSDHNTIQLTLYSTVPMIFLSQSYIAIVLTRESLSKKSKNKVYNWFAAMGITLGLVAGINDLLFTFRVMDSVTMLWGGGLGMQILFITSYYYISKRDEQEKNLSEVKLKEMKSEMLSLEEKRYLVDSVVHDLKSPIGMLKVIDFSDRSKGNQSLMAKSLDRILSISERLQKTVGRSGANLLKVETVVESIQDIINEKKKEYSHQIAFDVNLLEIDEKTIVCGNENELQAILSNILNNSIEVIGGRGRIELLVSHRPAGLALNIEDDGAGVPESILQNLGKRGFSYSKEGGTGLGLYSAKKIIASWGGELSIYKSKSGGVGVEIVLIKT